MRAPARIVPFALRVGVVALLIIVQVRAALAPGLTGPRLAITVVTGALAVTLLAIAVQTPLRRLRRPFHGATPQALDHSTGTVDGPQPAEPPHQQPAPPAQHKNPTSDHTAQPQDRAPQTPGHAAQPPSWTPHTDHTALQQPVAQSVLGVPLALIALGLAVILSEALLVLSQDDTAIAALFLCSALAAMRFPLRQSLPVGFVAAGGLLVVGVVAGSPAQYLAAMLSVCLIYLIAYAVRQRRAARAAEAREAVLAERARIARELHDILAHSLSAQLVHLEGAKLLLRAERTAEALDRVTRARDLAKSGLDEARRAVSALRESPAPLPESLRALAEEFESATRQDCELRVRAPERRLVPETELALVRTAQEALTNVRRHAPGSPVTVELTCDRSWCDLRVTNPTPAPAPATPTPTATPGDGASRGYGLMGMRERAELVGGTLTAGEQDGSFVVHLRVPA